MKKRGILALFVLFCILLAACGKKRIIWEQYIQGGTYVQVYQFDDKSGHLIIEDSSHLRLSYSDENNEEQVNTYMLNDWSFPFLIPEKNLIVSYALHRIDSCYFTGDEYTNETMDELVSFHVSIYDLFALSDSDSHDLSSPLKEIDMKPILKKYKLRPMYLAEIMKDAFLYEDKIYLEMTLADASEFHQYYCPDDDIFYTQTQLLEKFPEINLDRPKEIYIKYLSVDRDFRVYQNINEPTTYVLTVYPDDFKQFFSSGLPLFKKLADYEKVLPYMLVETHSMARIVLYDIQNEDELLKLITPAA